VRRAQLDELAAGIERLSADRAVVVGGDLNCAYGRAGDWELLMGFRDRLGLLDSGAGPLLPHWRERDHILYRSGPTVALAVESAGEALEFVNDGRALSDHPAVFARFRVGPGPATRTGGS
jgi:endonuclease/exonuclease/phosphatase (EEP) superfamily protein YafD